MVDTSGHFPPVITALRMEGGVYTDNSGNDDSTSSILQGRISLSIIAVLIVGAAGFLLLHTKHSGRRLTSEDARNGYPRWRRRWRCVRMDEEVGHE